MNKLGKGLKKKIKGNKSKQKEDDLDRAELEKYRREAAAEATAAAASTASAGSEEDQQQPVAASPVAASNPPNAVEESDEWKKFRLLTSGTNLFIISKFLLQTIL